MHEQKMTKTRLQCIAYDVFTFVLHVDRRSTLNLTTDKSQMNDK